MPRFYLINFHYPDFYSREIYTPSLGPGYILESLIEKGFEVRYWEYSLKPDSDAMISEVQKFNPDVIGCSFFSNYYFTTYEIIEHLASLNIPIVCGGVHVNTIGSAILEETKATFAIRGEGEESLPLLLTSIGNELAYEFIPGLIYRSGGKIISNPVSLIDFNAQAFPTYRSFDLTGYRYNGRNISTSRGCPYRCTYCAQSALLGKRWRRRSAENIMFELEYWASRGIREFCFTDDNFTLDMERVKSLCRMIQRSSFDFHLSAAGVRMDNVDEDLLLMMKDSGFRYLSFGVESGNDRVLKEIRKGLTLHVIHRTLETVTNLDYTIKLYFIINNRTETYEEATESFQLADQYPIREASFTNLVPYPGTYDFEWIQMHGKLRFDPKEYLNRIDKYIDEPLYEGPGMTLEKRRALIKEAALREKRYRPSIGKDLVKGIQLLSRFELKRLLLASRNRIRKRLR